MPPISVREALAKARDELTRANTDSPGLEAELLLAYALRKSRSWLFAWPEHALSSRVQTIFADAVGRRSKGEPIAYITGQREFWSLSLKINDDTLIPRPETELLVEQTLALPTPETAQVADLGTGSGAIAAALAKERPNWRILATDADASALATAEENFRHLGLSNIQTKKGHWLDPLESMRFHVIVSNPPYVAEGDPHLEQGDLKFEPRQALSSGPDGLRDLRIIVMGSPNYLVDGGILLVEHGESQGQEVRRLFIEAGFLRVRTTRDLEDRERVTEGWYKCGN